MHALALIIRVTLAFVFGLAGAMKLRDLPTSRDTVQAFGVAPTPARVIGTLLPVAELATAVALLPSASARWGAVAAVALLVSFSAGVGVALANDRTPACNCFGQVSSHQISWRTLARNGVLIVLAAFAVWKGPGSSLGHWTTNAAAASLVAGLAVVALGFALVAALHFRLVSARLEKEIAASTPAAPKPLSAGDPAPSFTLPTVTGAEISLDALRERGRPVLLVFASPACTPCRSLLPELGRWSSALADRVTFLVVESTVANPDELARDVEGLPGLIVAMEPGLGIPMAYLVRETPTAFLIDPDGTISAPATPGSEAIERLVRTTLRRRSTQPAGVA